MINIDMVYRLVVRGILPRESVEYETPYLEHLIRRRRDLTRQLVENSRHITELYEESKRKS